MSTNLETLSQRKRRKQSVGSKNFFAAFVTFCSENSLCLLVSIRGYINCVMITLPYSLIIEATEDPLGVRHFLPAIAQHSTLNSVKERGSHGALRSQPSVLAALIQGLFSPQAIAFSVQFTLRCRRARALFARTRLCPRKLLSPT